ncbi:Uncharacterised protein [Serratia fonticola]|uniref:Uncharacterized protein n=1 Tax=Serratia fonticola TaxID=47917 RepID=A0A3S4WBR1_SERFO|nr:Uncharacterised protein [Serratia fonticola]
MYHPQNPQSVLSLRHRVGLATVPLGLLLLWLTALIPLYLPNMGGSGLKLPHNIITWGLMAAVVATIWLTQPAAKAVHLTVTARWALLAIVILAIPLIYTPPTGVKPRWRAGWRCSAAGFSIFHCCNTVCIVSVVMGCITSY